MKYGGEIMLNKLWPCFIVISFVYAMLNFNMNELNNSIFDSCKQTIEMLLVFGDYVYVEWNNGNC